MTEERSQEFLRAAYRTTTPDLRRMAAETMFRGGLVTKEGKELLGSETLTEESFLRLTEERAELFPRPYADGEGALNLQYWEDLACIMPATGLHEMGEKYEPALIGCVLGAFWEFLQTRQTGAAFLYHRHKLPNFEIEKTLWIWWF